MKNSLLKEIFSKIWEGIRSFLAKIFSSRILVLAVIFIVLFFVLTGRLFYLQIIQSDYYTENFILKTKKTVSTLGPRGNIYDRNGELLAHNEIAYYVTITDEFANNTARPFLLNKVALKTVELIEQHGDKITEDFNIDIDENGNYLFKENPITRQITFLCNIYGKKSDDIYEAELDKISAPELIEAVYDKFGIKKEYTEEEQKTYGVPASYTEQERLKIAIIRYNLSLNAYQKYVETEISGYINDNTKAAILECTDELKGVNVRETYRRVYDNAIYFSSIIGYTGEISEEELKEYNLENPAGITYEAGDLVGKAGIEKSFDSYLQGAKGSDTLFVDNKGAILGYVDSSKPAGGNDVYLTLDSKLQIAAYNILEKKLAACLINKIVNYDYVATEKQTYVYIPIKDVYFKLLTNVIDPSKFSRNNASQREKNIYNQYIAKESVVIQGIIEELKNINALNVGELSDEYNDYMFFVYDLLGSEGILDKNAIDMDDSVYVRWTKEQVSLREFLQRAISENWINVNILDNDAKYANSDEIYAAIMDRLEVLLVNNKNLSERIYYYMIYNGEISPYDICYILYDQGCLEEDDAFYGLEAGEFDTFSYVIRQIEALNITPAMLALDPCSGALTITDTKTGKVLAMVTYPSYDNNKLSGEIDTEYWNKINNDDSQPLFNRATQALTAPGSTFKLCTSVCGLNEGLITPGTYIYDNIYFEEVTPSPKCFVAPASHGSVNVSTALQESCNYFYFYLGYQLGCDTGTYNSALALDKIENYAVQLGLGMKSGVEIEETNPRVSNTDSVRSAIGQGTNGYASVHMTRYVNTIANRGDNYQLTLLDKIVNKSGMLLVQQDPVISNHLEMSSTNWDAVQTGMRLVILSGTASSFFTDLGVTVAGKTGTAEENIYRSNHGAFVGYAPYENPEVSFSCMIRNCDSTSYPGGVLCDTLKYYFGETSFEDVLNAKVENTIQGFHSE